MDNFSSNNENNRENPEVVESQNPKKKSKKILFLVVALILIVGIFGCVKFFKTKPITNSKEITIPIAMAADDNYTYPTIVAMTSILENAKPTTKYEFYIMVPGNFSQSNKEKILSLKNKYEKSSINLINMEDRFKNANSKGHITTPTYYRLSLSSLLPTHDKIIWLDGDTLTLDDLTDMFNIDMENYYYKGLLDDNVYATQEFGVDDDHYICAGVMLINLNKLRQDNMEEKFTQFIEENNEKLTQHDQTVINILCYENIGALPPQYGIFNYYLENADAAINYNTKLNEKYRYNLKDILKAQEKPVVVHCVIKPWKDKTVPYFEQWWDYAKKTGFYDEIRSMYKIF